MKHYFEKVFQGAFFHQREEQFLQFWRINEISSFGRNCWNDGGQQVRLKRLKKKHIHATNNEKNEINWLVFIHFLSFFLFFYVLFVTKTLTLIFELFQHIVCLPCGVLQRMSCQKLHLLIFLVLRQIFPSNALIRNIFEVSLDHCLEG